MRNPNKTETDEDYELVSRSKKGDTDALESLVVKHQKRMLNISYRMTGNYEDACEVVQDSFVSAYRNLRKFQEKARFSTWLYAIVVNLSRNRLKQIRTRDHHEAFSMDETIVNDEDALRIEVASDDPPVHEQIEKRELQRKVQDCIRSLDDEYKEVIILRDIQEFAYDEIRDMLKIPEGTVKSRISRAREALKECLKKVMGEM